MDTIKATFVINTPMFLGDYKSERPAEGIRPPSVKGALRFWWRALQWSAIRSASADDREALQKLHRKEAELFGIAAETYKDLAQASVMLTVLSNTKAASKSLGEINFWHGYLLGQGLSHFRDGLLRKAIPAPGAFQVIVYFKKNVSDADQTSVMNALQVFGLLGGLGSRARRGWGSVSLSALTFNDKEQEQEVVKDKNQYIAMLKKLLTPLHPAEPPFSAFSGQSQIMLEKLYSNPLDALKKAGEEMAMYRSWGRNGEVNRQRAEKNFRGDHDLVLAIGNNPRAARPAEIPKRSVFGLPHNYFYSSQKVKVDVNAAGSKRTRRGSPLFIHIQKIGNQYALVQTVLQAKFLPEGDAVEFKVRRDGVKTTQTAVEWQVLEDYLDRFPSTKILP